MTIKTKFVIQGKKKVYGAVNLPFLYYMIKVTLTSNKTVLALF